MNDSFLLKLAIITALIGITALHFLSSRVPFVSHAEFLEASPGDALSVQGEILSINYYGNLTVMQVAAALPVVLEGDANLLPGQRVIVSGEVQEYRGEKQLKAEKVKLQD